MSASKAVPGDNAGFFPVARQAAPREPKDPVLGSQEAPATPISFSPPAPSEVEQGGFFPSKLIRPEALAQEPEALARAEAAFFPSERLAQKAATRDPVASAKGGKGKNGKKSGKGAASKTRAAPPADTSTSQEAWSAHRQRERKRAEESSEPAFVEPKRRAPEERSKFGLNRFASSEGEDTTGSEHFDAQSQEASEHSSKGKRGRGSKIGRADFSELDDAQLLKRCVERGAWMCSQREQLSSELAQKLGTRLILEGVPKERAHAAGAQAALRLAELGYQSDARFCRAFIRMRLSRKSLSQAQRELAGKGAPAQVIAAAVESLQEEELIPDPSAQLRELWIRKFKGERPADEKAKGKQARFFISRGFSYQALQKIWKSQDED